MKNQSGQDDNKDACAYRGLLAQKTDTDIVKPPADCGDQAKGERAHLSNRKKGIMKTGQASSKKIDPNVAQKFPVEATQKPMAEVTNKIEPRKLL